MHARQLLQAITAALFVAASAGAFAQTTIGYEVFYVLNPNGRASPQTTTTVGDALGPDVWCVPGTYGRLADPLSAVTAWTDERKQEAFLALAPDHAFGLYEFGHQADG